MVLPRCCNFAYCLFPSGRSKSLLLLLFLWSFVVLYCAFNHRFTFRLKHFMNFVIFCSSVERTCFFAPLDKMTKKAYPKKKITKHAFDRHRRLLAEMPESVAARQQNIHNRNEMLAATQAYNLRLEKQRIQSHISNFAAPLHKAMAQHYMGDLDRKIHQLVPSGLP